MKPSEFWALTFAEFDAMAKGFNRRQINRRNELMFAAWHCAAIARQKTLPELDDLLINPDEKPEPKKEQTDTDMLNMCKMLNAMYGGEVVEVCGD